ncbi:hypothetical protein GF382_00120 [Candidatus Falkowbacteria bacterium]|nr:hypothetical protein [Candidatus Falkowbacteria bacterium]
MLYVKEQTAEQVNAAAIARFLLLAGVASILPFYIHIQWLTGPIVNAILIIVLFLIGVRSALVVCLIPSLMALSGGLLPAILAPVVPYIMISNVIFVLSVEFFYKNMKSDVKGYWTGVFTGALSKFLFLFASVNIISRLLIKKELAVKVAQMMSWPQLATAVAGGVLAFMFLKWIKRI